MLTNSIVQKSQHGDRKKFNYMGQIVALICTGPGLEIKYFTS